jgi:hypothetical protein
MLGGWNARKGGWDGDDQDEGIQESETEKKKKRRRVLIGDY